MALGVVSLAPLRAENTRALMWLFEVVVGARSGRGVVVIAYG
jgi:hypothetical protein